MSRHVASTKVICPQCQQVADCTYVATSGLRELRFGTSWSCSSCGLQQELDGRELSDEAREAFVVLEGRWSGLVREFAAHESGALAALRTVRADLLPIELVKLIREGKPIVEGTLVEVEAVESHLEQFGIRLAILRLDT